MKYKEGLNLVCVKTFKQIGSAVNRNNFIKGKIYNIEEVFSKKYGGKYIISIKLINEQGEPQTIEGQDKTKFFKLPRPEGVPVTPPPNSKAEKAAARKAKKEAQKLKQTEEKNQDN